jgi:hypothetical protein
MGEYGWIANNNEHGLGTCHGDIESLGVGQEAEPVEGKPKIERGIENLGIDTLNSFVSRDSATA